MPPLGRQGVSGSGTKGNCGPHVGDSSSADCLLGKKANGQGLLILQKLDFSMKPLVFDMSGTGSDFSGTACPGTQPS
jgi:hypothetical protein